MKRAATIAAALALVAATTASPANADTIYPAPNTGWEMTMFSGWVNDGAPEGTVLALEESGARTLGFSSWMQTHAGQPANLCLTSRSNRASGALRVEGPGFSWFWSFVNRDYAKRCVQVVPTGPGYLTIDDFSWGGCLYDASDGSCLPRRDFIDSISLQVAS